MTSKMLLEQYMAERHALGFSLKTDEGCIRRFLQDFAEPDDGEISFTKEYVLDHNIVLFTIVPNDCTLICNALGLVFMFLFLIG